MGLVVSLISSSLIFFLRVPVYAVNTFSKAIQSERSMMSGHFLQNLRHQNLCELDLTTEQVIFHSHADP